MTFSGVSSGDHCVVIVGKNKLASSFEDLSPSYLRIASHQIRQICGQGQAVTIAVAACEISEEVEQGQLLLEVSEGLLQTLLEGRDVRLYFRQQGGGGLREHVDDRVRRVLIAHLRSNSSRNLQKSNKTINNCTFI